MNNIDYQVPHFTMYISKERATKVYSWQANINMALMAQRGNAGHLAEQPTDGA